MHRYGAQLDRLLAFLAAQLPAADADTVRALSKPLHVYDFHAWSFDAWYAMTAFGMAGHSMLHPATSVPFVASTIPPSTYLLPPCMRFR